MCRYPDLPAVTPRGSRYAFKVAVPVSHQLINPLKAPRSSLGLHSIRHLTSFPTLLSAEFRALPRCLVLKRRGGGVENDDKRWGDVLLVDPGYDLGTRYTNCMVPYLRCQSHSISYQTQITLSYNSNQSPRSNVHIHSHLLIILMNLNVLSLQSLRASPHSHPHTVHTWLLLPAEHYGHKSAPCSILVRRVAYSPGL
jgi:hypothetical protein